MFTPKKIALGTSAVALALGLGLGTTGMASATTTPTPAPTASATSEAATGNEASTSHSKRGHGPRGGADAAALAAKLGVDEATVTSALQAAMDAAKADIGTGEKPDRGALESAIVKSLADALDLEEAAVQTALDELGAERKAERSAAVQNRLNAAVADGSLTQAEADGAAKAHKLGILGGGGRG